MSENNQKLNMDDTTNNNENKAKNSIEEESPREYRRKIFVLDTNVLIHDPQSLYAFEDNKIVLPMKVIEELDKFKSYKDEKGHNVREVIREIDKLRGSKGRLDKGIEIPQRDRNGILQIVSSYLPNYVPDFYLGYDNVSEFDLMDTGISDNEIILTALKLQKDGEDPVTFVSNDLNSRIKASSLGINVQKYNQKIVVVNDLYHGYVKVNVSKDIIDRVYKGEDVHISEIDGTIEEELRPNTFIRLEDSVNENHRGMGRYIKNNDSITPIYDIKDNIWGIKPKNIEQRFAFDALLNDKIQLVTLIGQAGTGKTLLALAAALKKTSDENVFNKIVVSRPIIPMGKDIGYMPGGKDEKLHLWMQPIFDNLRFIFSAKSSGKNKDKSAKSIEAQVHNYIDKGVIELEALTYIRGRSLPNQYLIIDEAQNLTHHEIKTIISRAGSNTKVVLTGDPYQIDNPYLDSSNNGLIYAIDKFKNHEIHGHVTLAKSERSELASLATKLL